MVTTNIARTDDGTIQINFSIPKIDIDKAQETAISELAKDVTLPGFRKGKAPLDKAKEKIDAGKLLEKTLGKILPEAYTKALTDNKIRPIIYPKFEIFKQGETWEVQAKVAELPEVDLGDFKNLVGGAIRAELLKKELTKEEKEQVAIKALLASIKVKIAKIIIDEEVNARLSGLLARIEKLGLQLESYLASIGKDEKTLREEYEKQIGEGISLELILNKIADQEKVEIPDSQVDAAVKASGAKGPVNDEQRILVKSVLKRRAALDQLISIS